MTQQIDLVLHALGFAILVLYGWAGLRQEVRLRKMASKVSRWELYTPPPEHVRLVRRDPAKLYFSPTRRGSHDEPRSR